MGKLHTALAKAKIEAEQGKIVAADSIMKDYIQETYQITDVFISKITEYMKDFQINIATFKTMPAIYKAQRIPLEKQKEDTLDFISKVKRWEKKVVKKIEAQMEELLEQIT